MDNLIDFLVIAARNVLSWILALALMYWVSVPLSPDFAAMIQRNAKETLLWGVGISVVGALVSEWRRAGRDDWWR